MALDKKKALGRGLGALIPNLARPGAEADGDAANGTSSSSSSGEAVHALPPGAAASSARPPARRDYFVCPVEEVGPSRDNPRQRFDEQRLTELADSIRAQGLVQPLVVRQRSAAEMNDDKDGPRFILIAGERRWRAAQRAGLKDVPVVVKDVDAAAAFELALVENLQREDLNPIEEAEAYRRLSSEFGYTQEELARRVGRERTTVANSLRLLKLPSKVQEQVAVGQLSMGHARALLGLESANSPGQSPEQSIEESAQLVIQKQLSVRQTEELVRRAGKAAPSPKSAPKPEPASSKSASVRDVEERLQKALGTRVALKESSPKSGTIEIQYHSLDELDRLIAHLTGESEHD